MPAGYRWKYRHIWIASMRGYFEDIPDYVTSLLPSFTPQYPEIPCSCKKVEIIDVRMEIERHLIWIVYVIITYIIFNSKIKKLQYVCVYVYIQYIYIYIYLFIYLLYICNKN